MAVGRTIPEWYWPWSRRCLIHGALHLSAASGLHVSSRQACRAQPARIPFRRRALLRLSLIFRDPEPEQLARRTNQCDFRFHQNAEADAETFAAATRGGVLGRRLTAAPGGIAARL